MTASSFIEFVPIEGRHKSGWAVVNKRHQEPLGAIMWYSGWRDYVLRPIEGAEFSAGCLRDIIAFMDKQR